MTKKRDFTEKEVKELIKKIFEDIEKRMGELDPVMEIWAISEEDWQDLKKRWCGE